MRNKDIYYSKNPVDAKIKFKKRFEPKMTIQITVSSKCVSQKHFKANGLVINQEICPPKYHINDDYRF